MLKGVQLDRVAFSEATSFKIGTLVNELFFVREVSDRKVA